MASPHSVRTARHVSLSSQLAKSRPFTVSHSSFLAIHKRHVSAYSSLRATHPTPVPRQNERSQHTKWRQHLHQQSRLYSTTPSEKTYSATVVGAGPAGLAIVGNLLASGATAEGPIAWIDPSFKAGKLGGSWREVPSNTRVGLFVQYAEALAPFQQTIRAEGPGNPVDKLKALEQSDTCKIAYAADMVDFLARGVLREFPDAVEQRVGTLSGADYSADIGSTQGAWTVQLQRPQPNSLQTFLSKRLILATGAEPSHLPLPVPNLEIQRLDLSTALTPSVLASTLPQSAPTTIAVVGGSHSGILVLMNLFELARTTHPNLRVKWFTRSSLRYAEYKDGWILYDNTGLKGNAATFAREQLDGDNLKSSEAGNFIDRVDLTANKSEKGVYQAHLPQCTHFVHATGFTTNGPPQLTWDGKPVSVSYDHLNGGFSSKEGETVPGLYGAGIAYPERVTDRAGNVELSVGLFKFMKYLKRVVPAWLGKAEGSVA